jgi:hypothetical protein
MSENETENNKIVYQLERRNPFYVFFGDLCPSILFLCLSYAIVKSDNPSLVVECIGILLVVISTYFLLESITFKKITIYKDRVVVDKLFFGKSSITIDDIKNVNIGGANIVWKCLDFAHKTKRLSPIKYSITALYDEDANAICEIIKNLQGAKKR